MRRLNLSAADRRALRFGAFLAVPVLTWSFAVRPYAAAVDASTQSLEQERELLTRERALVAAAPEYPGRLLDANQALRAQRSRRFTGADPFSSTALLASHLADIAIEHEVRVDRTEAREPREGEAGPELRVALEVTGDIRGVAGWLHSLENGSHALLVERLDIRRGTMEAEPWAASEPAAAAVEPLSVSIEVLAFASPAQIPSAEAP